MKLSKTFMHRSPGISTGGGGVKFGVRWPLFHLNDLQTVLVQAFLIDKTRAVTRAPCISLNLPLCLAAVSCSLQ